MARGFNHPGSILVLAVFAQVIALIMDSTTPLTCEPVIPDARRYVSCRHNLRRHKVFLSAVHFHSIVALDEHNAEEEPADHLSEQHKQHCLGQRELTEHKPKVPAIVYQQTSQLIPSMLLTLHRRRRQFHACRNRAYNSDALVGYGGINLIEQTSVACASQSALEITLIASQPPNQISIQFLVANWLSR